jgi:hypothetical protein
MIGRRSGALAGKWRITEMSAFVAEHRSVTLMPDGTLEGEFAYDNGDESTLKARPW